MSLWSWRRRERTQSPPPPPPPQQYGPLVPGWRYRIVRGFRDHDGIEHAPGECWRFERHTFLPYEDGLSLFVTREDGGAAQIRLQTRPEAEGPIAQALEKYLLPVPDRADRHALMLTRDSVCMADDVDARHPAPLSVDPDADAAGVAQAILDAKYLAYTSAATWSLALGADRVVFGWGLLRRFVTPVPPGTLSVRARAIERVDVTYHAQEDLAAVVARLAAAHDR